MSFLVSLLLVLFALACVVGVMYVVLSEKKEDESKIKYVRSPYAMSAAQPEPPKPEADKKPVETVFTPPEEKTGAATDASDQPKP